MYAWYISSTVHFGGTVIVADNSFLPYQPLC